MQSNTYMLDNTLTLKASNGASIETTALSLTDTDDGRTIRTHSFGSGNKVDLTIAVTESTENKGILSDRIMVRVDETKVESTSPYAAAKASAYLVIVAPRRPDFTAVDIGVNVGRVFDLLLAGEFGTNVITPGILDRILAGEK